MAEEKEIQGQVPEEETVVVLEEVELPDDADDGYEEIPDDEIEEYDDSPEEPVADAPVEPEAEATPSPEPEKPSPSVTPPPPAPNEVRDGDPAYGDYKFHRATEGERAGRWFISNGENSFWVDERTGRPLPPETADPDAPLTRRQLDEFRAYEAADHHYEGQQFVRAAQHAETVRAEVAKRGPQAEKTLAEAYMKAGVPEASTLAADIVARVPTILDTMIQQGAEAYVRQNPGETLERAKILVSAAVNDVDIRLAAQQAEIAALQDRIAGKKPAKPGSPPASPPPPSGDGNRPAPRAVPPAVGTSSRGTARVAEKPVEVDDRLKRVFGNFAGVAESLAKEHAQKPPGARRRRAEEDDE